MKFEVKSSELFGNRLLSMAEMSVEPVYKAAQTKISYVSLQLRVQNRNKKGNFPLNFRTMRKLSERYSGIFQTQSSGCASGVDHFRNFTKLKILNI